MGSKLAVGILCLVLASSARGGGAASVLVRHEPQADLADQSTSCADAFFTNLQELAERPVTLTAPLANNGLNVPNHTQVTRKYFEAAVTSQRTCVQRQGRYFGVRGVLPGDAAESLQRGASQSVHFGICVPRQCPEQEVAGSLAALALQFMLGQPYRPRLVGHSGPTPEVEELGVWSSMRVDFVIAGFAKCGTTALAAYLDRHPDLRLGDVGAGAPYFEDSFFITADLLPSVKSIEDFRQRHGDPHGSTKIGIKYPHMLFRDLVLMKVFAANPSVVLVLLFRDPIDWLESTFRWYATLNAAPPSFPDHALGGDSRRTGLRNHGLEVHFTMWVRRLWTFGFQRRQVYVLHMEGIDGHAAMRLCQFLGVQGAPPGSLPLENVNTKSSFDLCAAIQSDRATLAAVVQLKQELVNEYDELPHLLAENGEMAPFYFINRRSRCERMWWGVDGLAAG